ncbi:hypothetical protein GNI_020410 [Gregarina niphandrodes]|uniref:Uncharacterized protein n=1 Tax=Gregarina niphandrodes TaxID=110365 RepID=A0A023BBS3_GRENI|nr:hypothetical protein GNI_020410 [Gregarina niphandrodes]EZG81039.1 hypothetical protein GNI_020410 [Gregarina niphandrodes]|eukprot:XP_011134278.1 hypothetical protein GNI_020410 [Gregarina niphandrodes]
MDVATALLNGEDMDVKMLEEYANIVLDLYRVRSKNDDILQLDLDFPLPPSTSLIDNIKLYRGDWSLTDASCANEHCDTALMDELARLSGGEADTKNKALLFLRKICLRCSIPIPFCSICNDACFHTMILCTHCLPAVQPASGIRFSRMRSYGNPERNYGNADGPLAQCIVRPVCVLCRSRYRCPVMRPVNTRSSIGCKSPVLLNRFSFESLQLLLHLAYSTLAELGEPERLERLRPIVQHQTWRNLQRGPKLCDVTELCNAKKAIQNQWQRTMDNGIITSTTDNGTVSIYQIREDDVVMMQIANNRGNFEELYDPCQLLPVPSRARSDLSWIYYWLALAKHAPTTQTDSEPGWLVYNN